MAVETPRYEVLQRESHFEIRRYEGYITANVRIASDSYVGAVNEGFNPLADYIFGNNTTSGRIAMTAPVSAEKTSGERIAMTAPVSAVREAAEYVVSFTMPAGSSLETLPVPNNPLVSLREVPGYTAAVVGFSGYLTDSKQSEAQAELEAWMAEKGLVAVGAPLSAQYDSPWKPWFARRNEIIIPIADS